MFTGTLLPYQEQAVEDMITRRKMLVAYDLGLGKTVITIAACERLREEGLLHGPVLVVALASLKYQWAKEIGKFTDRRALVIDGTKPKRVAQLSTAEDFDYVVMNYEQVVNDWEILKNLRIDALIMDEATAIKGFRSKRSKKTKELARTVETRFALTGTPIENGRPEEIYSIMQAVDGRLLGRFDLFDSTFIVRGPFGNVERYRNLDVLHSRLSRNLIRKSQTDPDVAPHLPDTIHRDPELVPLGKTVRTAYRLVASELVERLEEAVSSFGGSWTVSGHYGHSAPNQPGTEEMGLLMSYVTLLRQLCSHPELVIESAEKFGVNFADALHNDGRIRPGGSATAYDFMNDSENAEYLIGAKVPKLDRLAASVTDHLGSDDDAKVVIFTTFLLSSNLIQQRVGGVTYSGRMSATEKEAAKVRFQTDPDTRILISTDAGGYGVDLPQANLLINYDLPWSAGAAVQRNGRIRRASSRWPSVVIQYLLVENSIEVRQWELLQQKSHVAAAVIDGRGINSRGGVDFSAGSLLEHLRSTS
jgi:SNF2 family DNA or RNA helicase